MISFTLNTSVTNLT